MFEGGGLHLLGQVAGALWGVQDLVVEDREVQGQAQADGVGGCQVYQGDILHQVKSHLMLSLPRKWIHQAGKARSGMQRTRQRRICRLPGILSYEGREELRHILVVGTCAAL